MIFYPLHSIAKSINTSDPLMNYLEFPPSKASKTYMYSIISIGLNLKHITHSVIGALTNYGPHCVKDEGADMRKVREN